MSLKNDKRVSGPISLPISIWQMAEQYKEDNNCKTLSEVFEKGFLLLSRKELNKEK